MTTREDYKDALSKLLFNAYVTGVSKALKYHSTWTRAFNSKELPKHVEKLAEEYSSDVIDGILGEDACSEKDTVPCRGCTDET